MQVINVTTDKNIYTCNVYVVLGDWKAINDINAMIDVAREKAAEEGVPFVEPDLSRIDYYRPF